MSRNTLKDIKGTIEQCACGRGPSIIYRVDLNLDGPICIHCNKEWNVSLALDDVALD